MANLLTATVRSSDGDAPLLSGQQVSLPVDEITLESVTYSPDSEVKTLVTHGRKKYLVSETVAQLVSAAGGELAPFTVSHKDGAQISPTEMAFPLENTSVEAISDDLKAELTCFGRRYTATGQAGAPFSGTAAQLRDKLAGEVFNAQIDTDPIVPIACPGDSFTVGAGQTPYPTSLCKSSKLPVFNFGVAGETSTQIKTRFLAAPYLHGCKQIFWVGTNNRGNPDDIKADVAAMIAALGHTDYVILPPINTTAEPVGNSVHTKIVNLSADLAALYGEKFIDIRAYLISKYNPSVPQDVLDYAADVIPSSLRIDTLHLNTAGYNLVAAKILEATGWKRPAQDKNTMRTVFDHGMQVSLTGTTTETNLIKVLLPPSIGKRGTLSFTGLASASNTTTQRRIRIRLNGSELMRKDIAASNISTKYHAVLTNRHSMTSQVAGATGNVLSGVTYGDASLPLATFSLDTAEPLELTVTGGLGATTDSIALESIQVMAIG
jgi:hypothetical protein